MDINNKWTLITSKSHNKKLFNKKNKLYLGVWCFDYLNSKIKNHKILNYHWNDRKKLIKDHEYLNELYEKILKLLSKKLNQIHQKNFDVSFWRIFIGPWLRFFLEIVYDRYSVINNLIQDFSNLNLIYDSHFSNEQIYIPFDYEDATSSYLDDEWNEAFFDLLIKKNPNMKFKINQIYPQNNKIKKKIIKKRNNILFNGIKYCFYIFNFLFNRNKKFFSLGTCFNFKLLIKINVWFNQIPAFWFKKKYNFTQSILLHKRKWTIDNINKNNEFENFLFDILPQNIPSIYVENFFELETKIDFKDWPKKPKYIMTSNSYAGDEIFKYWTAKNKFLYNSKILIAQHGGLFGIGFLDSSENHQISISDYFLSWGWRYKNFKNIFPIGNFLNYEKKIKHNKNGDLLILATLVPRYSYRLFSAPISIQFVYYLNNLKNFINLIPNNFDRKIYIRTHYHDYDWNIEKYLKNNCNNLEFDEKKISFIKSLKKYRLIISTSNTTTFLELLKLNIPSIVIFDTHYWELNKDAAKYFNKLKKVGIFYEDNKDASNFITNNWNNLDSWWNNKKLQNVKDEFCNYYSGSDDLLNKNLKLLINQIKK